MFTLIKRIFKSGWLSFSRDGGLAAATCFIMLIPIFLVTSLFLLKDVSQFLISTVQEKADISVYFKESASEKDILKVEEEISKIPEVKNVNYVSKEEALESFVQRHKDDPILMESLEEVGGNPFLAALNIKAFQAQQYQAVANFFEAGTFENLIEKVDYYQRKPVIERIFALTSGMEKAGWIIAIVLAIVAILVAFNTIRLAILNQKEEIKVQRLVGASNWFIRGPFLVQGTISGIFATIICLLIFTLICWFLSPKIEILFSGLNIWRYFTGNFFTIVLIQLVTGIGLGVISSTIAIRKYLKV
ncbi:MAG: ABC transporter permease [Candidatus Nealsonbacteria bacterium]|nr:MAG: ABC transporter permease [Candidatus Nealsonbacteria bacterium]